MTNGSASFSSEDSGLQSQSVSDLRVNGLDADTSTAHTSSDSSRNNIDGIKREDGEMSDDEDDIPLSERKKAIEKVTVKQEILSTEIKRPLTEDSDDDIPLSVRAKKVKKENDVKPTVSSSDHKKKRKAPSDIDDDYSPEKKHKKDKKHHHKEEKHKHRHSGDHKKSSSDKKKHKDKGSSSQTGTAASPNKKRGQVKEELLHDVWKWWEEEPMEEGVKWRTLEHVGPYFAPPYEPIPKSVKFRYDGKEMKLSEPAEEVATFYGKMLEHEYTTKPVFRKNFFKDWRKQMSSEERAVITDLDKCDFREMNQYFKELSEERKNRTKEEKQKLKEENERIQIKYGFAWMDGYKQKIGNFRIEPPGLFRGRGEHPRMGMLKKRVRPEDVIVNCSKGKAPDPPAGHKWKEIRHDNTVTWLASWVENVLGQNKYIMLNPSSKIKGQKDFEKYETARRLKKKVSKIRENYIADLKSNEMRVRQRAVALYFIDRLALRAGNEKDDSEAADTVGCCSLRCEHITLHEKYTFDDGREEQQYVVEFDFLGKDSIRYHNFVPVEKRVFKNLGLFMENKKGRDDLFDRLDTTSLNKHLQDLMPGLTAKVFRTYNASFTLQKELDKLEKEVDFKKASVPEMLLGYNRANRAVAILCNHQRSVPKSHENSMKNLQEKIKNKKKEVKAAKRELEEAKRGQEEKAKKKLARLKEQLKKLKLQETDKDEGKTIALGTSKLNYLDPRITVSWCKKHNVPIEKAYNKTQREKFQWAIEMVDETFEF